MAVSVTALEPGATAAIKLEYSAGETAYNIWGQLHNWLITRGWELWDNNADGDSSTTYVYRALFYGGTPGVAAHYKYMYLKFTSTHIILRVYELWDATAHTGTNKAPNEYNQSGTNVGETALAQRLDLTNGGYLQVFASARWFAFRGYNNIGSIIGDSTHNGLTGCFERERSFSFDTFTLGLPPVGYSNLGTNGRGRWTSVRQFDGSTGYANRGGEVCAFAYPEWGLYIQAQTSAFSTSVATQQNAFGNQFIPASVVAATGTSSINGNFVAALGRFFGLKALPVASANTGDTTVLLCDTNGFLSAGGSQLNHFCVRISTSMPIWCVPLN